MKRICSLNIEVCEQLGGQVKVIANTDNHHKLPRQYALTDRLNKWDAFKDNQI